MPPILEYIVILGFEKRYPKQNSVISLKSKILVRQIFLASPQFLGCLCYCLPTYQMSAFNSHMQQNAYYRILK